MDKRNMKRKSLKNNKTTLKLKPYNTNRYQRNILKPKEGIYTI